jgi:alginate O-acetyltransferase complex protein AlgI
MQAGMTGCGSRHDGFCCVTRGFSRSHGKFVFPRWGEWVITAPLAVCPTPSSAFMLFNSFDFLIFLVVVLALLRVSRHSVQNWILIAASCFFYGYWDWRFLGLLFFTSGIDFVAAQWMEDTPVETRRRMFVTLSVCANLGVLGFLKYSNFFIENVADLFSHAGMSAPHSLLHVVLPVGISFYTFQAMSYTIDVYRRRQVACRSLKDFLVYITFFPQLMAGPIERAGTMLPQFGAPRHVTRQDFAEGFYLVLWGLVKKAVIADNLATKVNKIFAQGDFTTADVLLGTLGFAFQIYGDFSGYTDMARGIARWIGVRLTLNFDHPYFAANPQEFWRRWHISLSTWLREYLYIPLGGNRGGPVRTYVNLMLTMLLGGLWHGAAWNYVAWGGYQGALLMGHRWFSENLKARLPRLGTLGSIASVALMFGCVLYGWLLFRLRSSAQLAAAHHALQHFHVSADFLPRLARMLPYIGLVLAVDTVTYFKSDPLYFARRNPWLTAAFYLVLIYALLIFGVTGGEQFIYFSF